MASISSEAVRAVTAAHYQSRVKCSTVVIIINTNTLSLVLLTCYCLTLVEMLNDLKRVMVVNLTRFIYL